VLLLVLVLVLLLVLGKRRTHGPRLKLEPMAKEASSLSVVLGTKGSFEPEPEHEHEHEPEHGHETFISQQALTRRCELRPCVRFLFVFIRG